MTKFYEKADFIELKNEWYDKLRSTDFRDLERHSRVTGEEIFFEHSRPLCERLRGTRRDEYYSLARKYLHTLPKRSIEYKVWNLHTQGKGRLTSGRELGLPEGVIRGHIKKIKRGFQKWIGEQHGDS